MTQTPVLHLSYYILFIMQPKDNHRTVEYVDAYYVNGPTNITELHLGWF